MAALIGIAQKSGTLSIFDADTSDTAPAPTYPGATSIRID